MFLCIQQLAFVLVMAANGSTTGSPRQLKKNLDRTQKNDPIIIFKKIDQTQNVITCELVLFTKEQPNYESANKGECGSSLIRHIDAYLHTLNGTAAIVSADPGD